MMHAWQNKQRNRENLKLVRYNIETGTNITRINARFLDKFIFVFSKFGRNRGPWAHRESFYFGQQMFVKTWSVLWSES